MAAQSPSSAAISQSTPERFLFSGRWTALGIEPAARQVLALQVDSGLKVTADVTQIEALDSAGAWVIQQFLERLRAQGSDVTLQGLRPEFAKLMDIVLRRAAHTGPVELNPGRLRAPWLERLGRRTIKKMAEPIALLRFIGATAVCFLACIRHPSRFRWRAILFNIRIAGVDALPIVCLLSFPLGVVVAYQGADQLRQYGANIFVADLVGVSMLREFAPLITAIIIAGRSGSAYAAQIGTMTVTEEIDALRTLGLSPQEVLVLPKVIALVIAMPLLTVAADVMGVFGGMLSARAQLDVSFVEFIDRLGKAIGTSTYLVGIGKAPVFAVIIAVVGCFQGFRTKGGPDGVGRQTTRSVVQAIFFVIVADALFSIVFTWLDL
jgi:phospholipid/cholesterol/gamma-HCH transport system permease protein